MTVNEQVVMAVGELATTLSRSPQFQIIKDLFDQQIAFDLLNTRPDQATERERIYANRQGMLAFVHHIAGLADQYLQMTAREEVDPEDDIDDPSVHDF